MRTDSFVVPSARDGRGTVRVPGCDSIGSYLLRRVPWTPLRVSVVVDGQGGGRMCVCEKRERGEREERFGPSVVGRWKLFDSCEGRGVR